MYGEQERLLGKIEEAKNDLWAENVKGVDHFKKFEETIEGLVKILTRAHDRIDTRALDNKALTKRVSNLEEKCDVLTGQVSKLPSFYLIEAEMFAVGRLVGVPLREVKGAGVSLFGHSLSWVVLSPHHH